MQMRDCQQECIDLIDSLHGGNHLVQMATGLGKTVTFANIPRKGRVLLLSHRDELVHQPIKYYDCPVGVEKAGRGATARRSSPPPSRRCHAETGSRRHSGPVSST